MDRQDKSGWKDYSVEKPEEGVYEWRVPSVAVPGIVVIVAAHMRKRGAGYQDVLSPVFDYWDGYRVLVPVGLQWRSTENDQSIKSYEQKLIAVEGLRHCECIYCGKEPTLDGSQRTRDGAFVVCAAPQHLNFWSLKCCAWGRTPSLSDPRELERIRKEAFARAALAKAGSQQ